MKHLPFAAVLSAALVLGAAPGFAGGFGVELPRFEFPAPQADASRGCQSVASAVATCTPAK